MEIAARINPISYEKPNYKRWFLHFSLLSIRNLEKKPHIGLIIG